MFENVHSYFSRILSSLDSYDDQVLAAERKHILMNGAMSLKKISFELNLLPNFQSFTTHFILEQRIKYKYAIFDFITSVEVYRNNTIEVVFFPIPKEVDYLNEFSKHKFLNKVSFDTAEVRMKELMMAAPMFMNEMCEKHKLAEKFYLYRILSQNISSIKWFIYALVVLLNINVMMAG